MRILTLNIWRGAKPEELLKTIERADADVYCFQEVCNAPDFDGVLPPMRSPATPDVFSRITTALSDHVSAFDHASYLIDAEGNDLQVPYGLSLHVRKNLTIEGFGNRIIASGSGDSYPGRLRKVQYVILRVKRKPVVIAHFHGLYTGKGKKDTPSRMLQSELVIEALKPLGPVVLGGDFNLRPESKALKLLEEELDLQNLIKKHRVKTTRTQLYGKRDREPHADYLLIPSLWDDYGFELLDGEDYSDHKGLIVDLHNI